MYIKNVFIVHNNTINAPFYFSINIGGTKQSLQRQVKEPEVIADRTNYLLKCIGIADL
nr:hypothetical protein [Mucilaginibacter sp. X4EP1]